MKITIQDLKKRFNPFTIQLTFESREEVDEFQEMLNTYATKFDTIIDTSAIIDEIIEYLGDDE
jgi:hypothetical protein